LPHDQLTNDAPRRNGGGGDKRSADAKMLAVQREEQIVALRLRHVSFTAIGRQLGVSKQAAQKAFYRAVRANTRQDIQTIHRTEIADLDLLEARCWQVITEHGKEPQFVLAAINAITRLHARRSRLLGLDAPTKLDIQGMYGRGTDEASADLLQSQRMIASLPIAEQVRLLEMFDEAERRLSEPITAAVETTGTLVNGTDHRIDADEDAGREE
jgi:hypothetical protein